MPEPECGLRRWNRRARPCRRARQRRPALCHRWRHRESRRAKKRGPRCISFGIERTGFLLGSKNPVNLAVGRSADVKSAFGVKSNGLRGEVSGIEEDSRFAVRIEAKYFRRR